MHGLSDDLVPEPFVAKLAHKLSHQRNIRVHYHTIDGANHFFSSHIDRLNQEVDDYLEASLHSRVRPPVHVAQELVG